MILVVLLHFLRQHLGLRLQRGRVQHQILDLRLLGCEEVGHVSLVVDVDLRVGGLRLRGVVLGVEALPLDVALVEPGVGGRLHRRRRDEAADGHALQRLVARQVLADHVEQQVPAEAALGQPGVALRLVHGARLGELGARLVLADDALVAGLQALVGDGGGHHAFAHDLVQRLALRLGRVEQLQVDARIAAADLVDVLAVLGVPFGARDVAAIDRGHRHALLVRLHVAGDAEEPERRDDQEAEPHLQDTVVRPDEIKHGKPLWQNDKGELGYRSSPGSIGRRDRSRGGGC